jgi:hypothetical protein
MVRSAPSNASGIGGRGRSATAEDMMCMNKFTMYHFVGGTNVLATKQPIPFFTPPIIRSATSTTGLIITKHATKYLFMILD